MLTIDYANWQNRKTGKGRSTLFQRNKNKKSQTEEILDRIFLPK